MRYMTCFCYSCNFGRQIITWYAMLPLNASVTTRRTCYGSCVSGAAAELRLKFCVSCGWLGPESDSAATVPATHVSCGRRAPDAPNRTQKIPQRRHVQRAGAVPSWYLQRAFAVPPATCPYGGVRVCTSVERRRCVEGTTHVRRTHGHTIFFWVISMILCSNMLTQAAHLHNNGHVNVIIMIGIWTSYVIIVNFDIWECDEKRLALFYCLGYNLFDSDCGEIMDTLKIATWKQFL